MRAKKRTAVFVKHQESIYLKHRIRRLKKFSNTRWTSHDIVVIIIYVHFDDLVTLLDEISAYNDFDSMSTAKSITNIVNSFKFSN